MLHASCPPLVLTLMADASANIGELWCGVMCVDHTQWRVQCAERQVGPPDTPSDVARFFLRTSARCRTRGRGGTRAVASICRSSRGALMTSLTAFFPTACFLPHSMLQRVGRPLLLATVDGEEWRACAIAAMPACAAHSAHQILCAIDATDNHMCVAAYCVCQQALLSSRPRSLIQSGCLCDTSVVSCGAVAR